MAIDLLHSLFQKGQAVSSQARSDSLSQTGQLSVQAQQLSRAVQSLQAGQTIQAEVLAVKGEEVQLALLDQLMVEAKLEQNIRLTPGTLMAFQVKSNNSNGLSLMPLFTNTAADPNVMKALDMAGIPLTERTLEMVKSLMQKGLPVDRQSLQEVYRDVAGFKDSPVEDILSLRQMKIPVTAKNLEQLSHYRSNHHLLNQTFSDIGKAIGNQLASWISHGENEKAANFLAGLKKLFPVSNLSVPKEEGKEVLQNFKSIPQRMEGVGERPAFESFALPKGQEESIAGDEGAKPVLLHADAGEEHVPVKSLPSSEWDQLTRIFFEGKEAGKASEIFQKIWKRQLQPQLMLEPHQVADKEEVKEYYARLGSQLDELQTLADKQQTSTTLGKAIQQTTSNLDFMNQMNQLHAYIQLPMKLSGREASGELYVFTNKKSLAKEGGKVTALLHLDMEYLGKMDVYVSLEDQKVETRFYLEKEEHLEFLEKHMDKLSQRLNKRGYECSIKSCLRKEDKEETVVMERIMDSASPPTFMSMQAFDMRA